MYRYTILNRPIDVKFDRFAMGCIDTYKLSQNVNFKSFETNGPKLSQSLIRYNSLKSILEGYPLHRFLEEYSKNNDYFMKLEYYKNHPDDFKNTSNRISNLKHQRDQIFESLNRYKNLDWPSLSRDAKERVKSEQKYIFFNSLKF